MLKLILYKFYTLTFIYLWLSLLLSNYLDIKKSSRFVFFFSQCKVDHCFNFLGSSFHDWLTFEWLFRIFWIEDSSPTQMFWTNWRFDGDQNTSGWTLLSCFEVLGAKQHLLPPLKEDVPALRCEGAAVNHLRLLFLSMWSLQLKGVAKFMNGTSAEEDIPLIVTVLDQNDNPPYFTLLTGNVTETSSKGRAPLQTPLHYSHQLPAALFSPGPQNVLEHSSFIDHQPILYDVMINGSLFLKPIQHGKGIKNKRQVSHMTHWKWSNQHR